MRILVTGASGNFGSGAVWLLLETVAAEDLILMSRKPDRLEEFALLGCTVRHGDFDAPETVEAAARGADKMLLISGHKVGSRIKQHGDAIEAAKRAGVSHIVYTSYFGSDADNPAMVCIDHHGTECKLAEAGVPWTVLRDGMYANSIVDAAYPAALSTGRWVSCAGDGRLSLIDRDDCIACAVAALVSEGHEHTLYNVVGTELWTFREMADLATAVTETPIEFLEVGEEEMYAHLDAIGIPRTAETEFNIDGYEWCSDDMVSYEREVGNGRFAIVSGDVETLLGRKPKPFRAFVEERAEQLRGARSR
jgi:NAD(P)H dehydrogenase (quinone)